MTTNKGDNNKNNEDEKDTQASNLDDETKNGSQDDSPHYDPNVDEKKDMIHDDNPANADPVNANEKDSSIKSQYQRATTTTDVTAVNVALTTTSTSTSEDNDAVKDQYRKDAKSSPATVTGATATNTSPINPKTSNNPTTTVRPARTLPGTTTTTTAQQQQEDSPLSPEDLDRVGAWRIQNPLHNRNNRDDDSSVSTTAVDEEMGIASAGDNNDDNGDPLVQAELVTDIDNNNNNQVMTLDAEILKDADAPERKRRRQMIRFVSVIIMIISIVVIVTVVVVNNNSGSGEVAPPTTSSPTTSPITPLPTAVPTMAPTHAPSNTPSQAPTQLTWNLAMGGTEGARLDGSLPFDQNFLEVKNSKVGSRVFVKDVANVTEFEDAQLLLALQYGGSMEINLGVGVGVTALERDVTVYLCGNTTTPAEDDKMDEPFCHAAFHASLGTPYGAMALSENGALLVMDSGLQGITLHDLRTATSLDGRGRVPNFVNVSLGDRGIDDPVQTIGISPTTGYIGILTEFEVILYELEGWEEPGQARPVNKRGFTPPIGFCPPFIPSCIPEPPKTLYHLVMSDHSMAVAINIGLEEQSNCIGGCFGTFNGFEIRVFDFTMALIGNIIEMGTNYTMIATQATFEPGGLAMTPDGKTLAVGSANFPRRDLIDGSQPVPYYQVDVYRLNEGNNLWEPFGSTLYGSRTGVQDNFGGTLAFNSDGTVLVVGASEDGSVGTDSGRLSTYQLVSLEGENGTFVEEWVPYLDDLTGSPGTEFGRSLDMTPSGDYLLVGAPLSDPNGEDSGEAFLYNLAGFS